MQVYSILEVAKMFGLKISYLPKRLGERYASALSNVSFNNKVHKRYGKNKIKRVYKIFYKKIISK